MLVQIAIGWMIMAAGSGGAIGERALAEGGLPWSSRTVSTEVPKEIEGVGVDEKLGSRLDHNLKFRDETGKDVTLGQYFDGQRPVFLAMVYYSCPNLCSLHLNGIVEGLRKIDWTIGKEFEFILVSMEPTETPDLALQKKNNYVTAYGRVESQKGWHFLTGSEDQVKKLAANLGFKYKWNDEEKQWSHTAVGYVVTPAGVIARYLYGITIPPSTFRLSLIEATNGKIGDLVDRIVLFCFHYDPNKRGYAFYAWNLMRAGAGLTVVIFVSVFLVFWLRQRRRLIAPVGSGDT